jgi:hypothetical protein
MVAFIYTVVIEYLIKTSELEMQDYDLKTITAGDYTVEMNIS